MGPLTVITRLWERRAARDWPAASRLIAEDAVIEWPVSGERIVGRDNFIAVNSDEAYSDERSVNLLRILADGDLLVTEAEVLQDHVVHRAVSLWTVLDGEIVGAREYWTGPGQDPAPAGAQVSSNRSPNPWRRTEPRARATRHRGRSSGTALLTLAPVPTRPSCRGFKRTRRDGPRPGGRCTRLRPQSPSPVAVSVAAVGHPGAGRSTALGMPPRGSARLGPWLSGIPCHT